MGNDDYPAFQFYSLLSVNLAQYVNKERGEVCACVRICVVAFACDSAIIIFTVIIIASFYKRSHIDSDIIIP